MTRTFKGVTPGTELSIWGGRDGKAIHAYIDVGDQGAGLSLNGPAAVELAKGLLEEVQSRVTDGGANYELNGAIIYLETALRDLAEADKREAREAELLELAAETAGAGVKPSPGQSWAAYKRTLPGPAGFIERAYDYMKSKEAA